MSGKTFSVVFESDVFKTKGVVCKALEFLTNVFPNLSAEALFEMKLVLSEALLNAVTHGNEENSGKNVMCEIAAEDDYSVVISIADEGDGFDYASIINDKPADNSLREYGRGIRLVCSLSDKVSYNEKGNKVKIYKKVVANEQSSCY